MTGHSGHNHPVGSAGNVADAYLHAACHDHNGYVEKFGNGRTPIEADVLGALIGVGYAILAVAEAMRPPAILQIPDTGDAPEPGDNVRPLR